MNESLFLLNRALTSSESKLLQEFQEQLAQQAQSKPEFVEILEAKDVGIAFMKARTNMSKGN